MPVQRIATHRLISSGQADHCSNTYQVVFIRKCYSDIFLCLLCGLPICIQCMYVEETPNPFLLFFYFSVSELTADEIAGVFFVFILSVGFILQ